MLCKYISSCMKGLGKIADRFGSIGPIARKSCIWVNFQDDAFSQNLVKSRRRKIGVWSFQIALKLGRLLDITASGTPAKCQNDSNISTTNLAGLRFTRLHNKAPYRMLKRDLASHSSPHRRLNKMAPGILHMLHLNTFLITKACNAENVSIWWRHHGWKTLASPPFKSPIN